MYMRARAGARAGIIDGGGAASRWVSVEGGRHAVASELRSSPVRRARSLLRNGDPGRGGSRTTTVRFCAGQVLLLLRMESRGCRGALHIAGLTHRFGVHQHTHHGACLRRFFRFRLRALDCELLLAVRYVGCGGGDTAARFGARPLWRAYMHAAGADDAGLGHGRARNL